MKFDQLIESIEIETIETIEIFFFKNHAENEVRRLVPDLFLFSKKAFYASGLQLSFNIF